MATNWEFSRLDLKKKLSFMMVVGLTAIFIVPTAATQCSEQRPATTEDNYGGTFQVAPGKSMEISNQEFQDRLYAYRMAAAAIDSPSLEYFGAFFGDRTRGRSPSDLTSAWAHLALVEAAREAGYAVGTRATNAYIRNVVRATTNQAFSPAVFEQFLSHRYAAGAANEFRDGMAEIALKDLFVRPFVETSKYALTKSQAFEKWKSSRERVNLAYWWVATEGFGDAVEKDERTRWSIGEIEPTLSSVVRTAKTVDSLRRTLESWSERNDGAWPESWDAATTGDNPIPVKVLPKDAFGEDLRYRLVDGKPDLRSAGADKTFDTSDDIGTNVQPVLKSHEALYRVAGHLGTWRKARDNQWPENIAALGEPTSENTPPLMVQPIKDGWDQELVYTAPEGESAPTLRSIGADGQANTADDLVVTLDPERVLVEPMGVMAELVDRSKADAFGRPLRIAVSRFPLSFEVRSAGRDGTFNTDDDLDRGNRAQVEAFYLDRRVRERYALPPRRSFETLTLQLPLIPDDMLRKMWNDPALAKFRPTDEEELFNIWAGGLGDSVVFENENPGDPESGHGVDVAEAMGATGVPFLIPAKDIFPADLATLASAEGDADGDDGEEGEDPAKPAEGEDPAKPAEEESEDSKLRRTYREKGWRQILIRQVFLENVMADLLGRIGTRLSEQRLWDEKKEKGTQEGERPADLTFETLIADELNKYVVGEADRLAGRLGFEYWKSDGLLDKAAVEALPHLGDPAFTVWLGQQQPGEGGKQYGPLVRLRNRNTLVLFRVLEFRGKENPSVDDPSIQEKVFGEYLEQQRLARAAEELEKLKDAMTSALADDAEGGEQKALDAFEARTGVRPQRGESGLFIGSLPPRPAPLSATATAEQKATASVHNAVWANGYANVRPTESGQDVIKSAAPGTWGRQVIRDRAGDAGADHDGISRAILVRVKEQVDPEPAEFSAGEYARYLRGAVYGSDPAAVFRNRLQDREGSFWAALTRFYADPDALRAVFDIKPNEPWENASLPQN